MKSYTKASSVESVAGRDLDRVGNAGIKPRRGGMLAVGVPLVMRRPEPRHQQDSKLAQRRRHRALEADIVAELAHAVGELRASQQCMERPAQAAARPAGYGLRRALLIEGHVVLGQWLEARRHVRWSIVWVAAGAGPYAIPRLSSLRAEGAAIETQRCDAPHVDRREHWMCGAALRDDARLTPQRNRRADSPAHKGAR
jgi:hypothetical protein